MKHIHFISGLPRSGSSLFSALLRQNPRFVANMSGPVAGLFNTLLGEMSGKNEFSVFIDDIKRQRILRGIFSSYYGDEGGDAVIFDTSRWWCTRLGALKILFPNSKIIACVRQLPWVLDSIERVIRSNAFQPSSIFNFNPGGTVYSRVEGILSNEGLVGFAYNALKEAYFGENNSNLMLLQYETLANDPGLALNAVYGFIGEPYYRHDFENVVLDNDEFDRRAGTPGLHRIRPRVEPFERKTLLPPDLAVRFKDDSFWRNPQLNTRGVYVV
ncbi:MAG TPA: sulfotransferase [Frateuria sp.]|uniref:sulfotransferase family protein n=1 Tax=Frateuria sp. TaxID=2211372 RepID=UPI002DF35888|nr:sulfotransferase [Frateuria sp.]